MILLTHQDLPSNANLGHCMIPVLAKANLACLSTLRLLQESEEALFAGCGFVPDLLTLQGWLERAWKAGIDTAGGDLLGNIAQGTQQWIGTTECAALLRFFGFKAEIVDFTGECKGADRTSVS